MPEKIPFEDLIDKITETALGDSKGINLVAKSLEDNKLRDVVEKHIYGLLSEPSLTQQEANFLLDLLRIHIDLIQVGKSQ